MPVIEAQDIINAVLQDVQGQTTNRAALYDYLDRINQRILRESKWRFLLSDPQTFLTLPGVSGYTLISGAQVPGAFQTNLELSNFGNIAPDSVFNLSNWTQLQEDADVSTSQSTTILQDGSLRFGIPRTYSNSLTNPGTIYIRPAPDDQNFYYPVPETPVVTYSPLAGCTLPARIYYGVVTFVDNFGGEGTPCVVPFTIAVPAGCVITVESPNPVPGGNIAANQAVYAEWNLYIGYSINNYYLQNPTPLQVGDNWGEPTNGIFTGSLPIPSTQNTPVNTVVSISPLGLLEATPQTFTTPPFPWALIDSAGNWWEVTGSGDALYTTSIPIGSPGVHGMTVLYLTDTSAISTWAVGVLTNGLLTTTVDKTPPAMIPTFSPPLTSTLQPLNGYVIQFRYYQSRAQITAGNPTQVLQIPYAYKDIVVAGVNYLANLYVDQKTNGTLSDRTMEWKRTFEAGLAQIRRDIRANYKQTDYISPDIASQYVVGNQQGIPTMGW